MLLRKKMLQLQQNTAAQHMLTRQWTSLYSMTCLYRTTWARLNNPSRYYCKLGSNGAFMYFCKHAQTQVHKVERRQSFSASEVVQNCWSALLVAELHKGGVISFRITRRKSNTGCADWFSGMETCTFRDCKNNNKTEPTSQDNDFTSPWEMWYFYHSVGIKCFCQCTKKERDHLSIHDTFLNKTKNGHTVTHQKTAADRATKVLFASHWVTYFSVCGFLLIWVVNMTWRRALKWPEDSCLVLHNPQKAHAHALRHHQQMHCL